MNSNIAKVIHEPFKKKINCSDRLNVELDEECLIGSGKVFHIVITLGTNDEYMYLS